MTTTERPKSFFLAREMRSIARTLVSLCYDVKGDPDALANAIVALGDAFDEHGELPAGAEEKALHDHGATVRGHVSVALPGFTFRDPSLSVFLFALTWPLSSSWVLINQAVDVRRSQYAAMKMAAQEIADGAAQGDLACRQMAVETARMQADALAILVGRDNHEATRAFDFLHVAWWGPGARI
jgi:hypothetical protein